MDSVQLKWYNETLNEIASVEQEIEILEGQLKERRAEKQRLKKKIYDGRTNNVRSNDSLFVYIREIRPVVKNWIDLYNREYGKGGQLLLSERSIVSTRLIRRVVNDPCNNGEVVTFQTAERLYSALGLEHRLNDLTIVNYNRVPEPPPSQYYEE